MRKFLGFLSRLAEINCNLNSQFNSPIIPINFFSNIDLISIVGEHGNFPRFSIFCCWWNFFSQQMLIKDQKKTFHVFTPTRPSQWLKIFYIFHDSRSKKKRMLRKEEEELFCLFGCCWGCQGIVLSCRVDENEFAKQFTKFPRRPATQFMKGNMGIYIMHFMCRSSNKWNLIHFPWEKFKVKQKKILLKLVDVWTF